MVKYISIKYFWQDDCDLNRSIKELCFKSVQNTVKVDNHFLYNNFPLQRVFTLASLAPVGEGG